MQLTVIPTPPTIQYKLPASRVVWRIELPRALTIPPCKNGEEEGIPRHQPCGCLSERTGRAVQHLLSALQVIKKQKRCIKPYASISDVQTKNTITCPDIAVTGCAASKGNRKKQKGEKVPSRCTQDEERPQCSQRGVEGGKKQLAESSLVLVALHMFQSSVLLAT